MRKRYKLSTANKKHHKTTIFGSCFIILEEGLTEANPKLTMRLV